MQRFNSLDTLVRARLKQWPQRPPGLPSGGTCDAWLRGRPAEVANMSHPWLKVPGSDHFRTLPDGLWLNFGGTLLEPFCDIFAIEACSSLANLLDKRSRFAPSMHSLLAVCPVPWLLAPATEGDPTPRWKLAGGIMRLPPTMPLVLPVRDIKVLYGLNPRHYQSVAQHSVPHAHEYFVPMSALTAEDSDKDPSLQALVARTAPKTQFLTSA